MQKENKPPLNLHQVLSLAKSCVSFVPKHIRLVAFPRIPAQFMRPEVWIPDAIEPIYYTADECLEAIDKVQTQLWKDERGLYRIGVYKHWNGRIERKHHG